MEEAYIDCGPHYPSGSDFGPSVDAEKKKKPKGKKEKKTHDKLTICPDTQQIIGE